MTPDENNWVVMAEFELFSALTGDNGAVLVPVDDTGNAGRVSRADILVHRDIVQAGEV